MPPSLSDAYERLRRADTELDELEGVVERFKHENAKPAVYHPNIQPSEEIRKAAGPQVTFLGGAIEIREIDLPVGTKPLVGTCIQNIRIPLDYLVYELAYLDSGSEQERTQFPIFWKRAFFRDREAEYLCGVNEAHRYAIELLQPYKGGKWLGTLAGLANPDKHKTLLKVGNAASVGGTGKVRTERQADGTYRHEMKMDLQFAPVILLDGRPVVESLEQLKTHVRAVVDEFEPCFRGECRHEAPPLRKRS